MRAHNKYLEKVTEEMDVYRQHLLTGRELTTQQAETFEKIDVMRGWLRDGFSDVDVIKLAKNDPRLKIMDRRARELLAMAYEVFGELRQARSREGIKFLYAERFRMAAHRIEEKINEILNGPEDTDPEDDEDLFLFAPVKKKKGSIGDVPFLQREWTRLMMEAAKIDGAYDNSPVSSDEKKKPTKITIVRKTVTVNSGKNSDEITQEAHYETIE